MPSRSFIFLLRFLIHFKQIFIQKQDLNIITSRYAVLTAQFVEYILIFQCSFCPLFTKTEVETALSHYFYDIYSIPLIFLRICQYKTAFNVTTLQYNLKLSIVSPTTLFLLQRIFLTIYVKWKFLDMSSDADSGGVLLSQDPSYDM